MTMVAKLCPAKIRHRSSLHSLLFWCLLLKSSLDSLLRLLFNSSVYCSSYKSSSPFSSTLRSSSSSSFGSSCRSPCRSPCTSSRRSPSFSNASLCRSPFYECPSSSTAGRPTDRSEPGRLSIKKLRKNHLPTDTAFKWLILLLFIFNFGQLDASRFSNLSSQLSPNSSANLSDSNSSPRASSHSPSSTNGAHSDDSYLMSFFSQLTNVSQTSSLSSSVCSPMSANRSHILLIVRYTL